MDEREQMRFARRMYMRQWRAKNKQKIRKYNKKFWLKKYNQIISQDSEAIKVVNGKEN